MTGSDAERAGAAVTGAHAPGRDETGPDGVAPDDLLALALVAEAASLSGASRQHGLSKATLSRAVARLERAAGAPLFDRTSRGLRPTPLGEALLPAARAVAAARREARHAMRSAAEAPAGTLGIAASALTAHVLVTPVLARLAEAHPAVRARLRVTSRMPDPLAEDLDVALHIGRPAQPSLVSRRILRGRFRLYAAARAVRGVDADDPRAVEGIERVAMAVPAMPDAWAMTHDANGRRTVLDRAPIVSVDDPTVGLDLVRAGVGMALVPALWADAKVERGELVNVLPRWSGPTFEIHAVMPPRRTNVPAVRAFLDALVGYAGGVGGSR